MKLDQLQADADLLRQHSLPLAAAGATGIGRVADDALDAGASDDAMPPPQQRPALFCADDEPWPAPPPPHEAMPRSSWLRRLAEHARHGASPLAASAHGDDTARAPRQVNLAPWLAGGVISIVLTALGAGLLSHRRIDAEAAQVVDAKRRTAEQALALLHSGERPPATAHNADDPMPAAAPSPEPDASTRADTPTELRARHDAMLASIKSGTVLASLPPSALAQPSALPAELPPAMIAPGTSRHAAATPAAPRPAKKVALVVEGTLAQAARAIPAVDPLATTVVKGTLKGAPRPQHRVYQLRESDGEWLGFVARADADPLADGVWAGSGDLLAGGWRVAEVTAQRLTLVGAGGALEILRP